MDKGTSGNRSPKASETVVGSDCRLSPCVHCLNHKKWARYFSPCTLVST